MNTNITNDEYVKILTYYKSPIPKSKRLLKKKAEELLAQKLCRCIKKIETPYEERAIGICTKTIFNRRGLTRGKFKCKGKPSVTFRKTYSSNKTRKSRK